MPDLLVFDIRIYFVMPESYVGYGAIGAKWELVIVVGLVHDKRNIELAEI